MDYAEEMIDKWEQYQQQKEKGEDTVVVVEEMLCLTDGLTSNNATNP